MNLGDPVNVNIVNVNQQITFQNLVVEALEPFPEAKLALVEKLKKLEG